jgi:5,10-methenyltetrahydrofolate synthetase
MIETQSSKEELRDFLRSALNLKGIAPWAPAVGPFKGRGEPAAFSQAIREDSWKAFLQDLQGARAVGLFVGVKEWAETSALEDSLKKILGRSCPPLAYPRALPDSRDVEFALCSLKDTTRAQNRKWFSAPADAPTVEPDVIFIPGMLMDSLGNRLGRGMGYYDRYLAKHPHVRRIGTIHSDWVVEEFSNSWIEDHDQPVEVLWTDRGVYRTPNFRNHNKERLL